MARKKPRGKRAVRPRAKPSPGGAAGQVPKQQLETALEHHQEGRLSQARRLYEQVLSRAPKQADALHFLGVLEHQQGEPARALELIGRAIDERPDVAAYRDNLGSVLESLGRLDDAFACYQEAARLGSEDADRSFNMGVVLERLNRPADAEVCYRAAIRLRPRDDGAHVHLGRVLLRQGAPAEAVETYGRALALAPHSVAAGLGLGRALARVGRIAQAAQAFLGVWQHIPGNADALRGFVSVVKTAAPEAFEPAWRPALVAAFEAPGVQAQELAYVTANQLLHRHRLVGEPGLSEALIRSSWVALRDDGLFDRLLRFTLNVHPVMERVLVELRRLLLLDYARDQRAGDERLGLVIALATQAFNGEYVLPASATEEALVARLRARIEECLDGPGPEPAAIEPDLMVLAMYLSPGALDGAPSLAAVARDAWSSGARELLRRAVHEPFAERETARGLESIAEITDPVSVAVEAQYEENPYPRWLALPRGASVDYATLLKRRFSHFRAPQTWRNGTRVLVAGCGTGQEALAAALLRADTEVVALDLSRASLAYGERMASELAARNVRFVQGDILDVQRLQHTFDVIETTGVLHHMHAPMEGWRALTQVLSSRGVMKVGLYSARAREIIVSARKQIRELGLTGDRDGILAFRARVFASEPRAPLRELLDSEDFYTTSACRDLLFHVQEHRFTITQIQDALASLELAFLGFELPAARLAHRYRGFAPEDTQMIDLNAWARFEAAHPRTFAGMYVFWCQKMG